MYYAVIAWDDCIIEGKCVAEGGDYVIRRGTLDYLVEGIDEYLQKWKGRDAYLESAFYENKKTHYPLTEKIKGSK